MIIWRKKHYYLLAKKFILDEEEAIDSNIAVALVLRDHNSIVTNLSINFPIAIFSIGNLEMKLRIILGN